MKMKELNYAGVALVGGGECEDIKITIGKDPKVEATLGDLLDCVTSAFSALSSFIATERSISAMGSSERELELRGWEEQMHDFGDPAVSNGWTVG
jgi:hypothetical protein